MTKIQPNFNPFLVKTKDLVSAKYSKIEMDKYIELKVSSLVLKIIQRIVF